MQLKKIIITILAILIILQVVVAARTACERYTDDEFFVKQKLEEKGLPTTKALINLVQTAVSFRVDEQRNTPWLERIKKYFGKLVTKQEKTLDDVILETDQKLRIGDDSFIKARTKFKQSLSKLAPEKPRTFSEHQFTDLVLIEEVNKEGKTIPVEKKVANFQKPGVYKAKTEDKTYIIKVYESETQAAQDKKSLTVLKQIEGIPLINDFVRDQDNAKIGLVIEDLPSISESETQDIKGEFFEKLEKLFLDLSLKNKYTPKNILGIPIKVKNGRPYLNPFDLNKGDLNEEFLQKRLDSLKKAIIRFGTHKLSNEGTFYLNNRISVEGIKEIPAENIQVLDKIGEGAHGIVFKVLIEEKLHVIKLFKQDPYLTETELINNILEEYDKAKIIQGLDLGPEIAGLTIINGIPALVIEYVDSIDPQTASYDELKEIVNEETLKEYQDAIPAKLNKEGYFMTDYQGGILKEDQFINGKLRKKGEVLILDAASLEKIIPQVTTEEDLELMKESANIENLMSTKEKTKNINGILETFVKESKEKVASVKNNEKSLDSLLELRGTYSELPEEGIDSLERMLGDGIKKPLSQLKPGKILRISSASTSIDLKNLNDRSGGHAKADLVKNYGAFRPLNEFLKTVLGYTRTGAFQKTLMAVKSEETETTRGRPYRIYEGYGYKVTVYEAKEDGELINKLNEKFEEIKKRKVTTDGGEIEVGDVLSAVLKEYFVKIEGKVPENVLDQISMDVYKTLTVARHYQTLKNEKVGSYTDEEIDNYVIEKHEEYKTADETRKKEIEDELAELFDSFPLTEDGSIMSVEQTKEELNKLIKQIEDETTLLKIAEGEKRSELLISLSREIIKLTELERTIRRKSTGHPKFPTKATGKAFAATIDNDAEYIIRYSPVLGGVTGIKGYYASTDVHDVGKENTNQNKIEIIENLLSKPQINKEDILKTRRMIGKERDKQIGGVYLLLIGHPEVLTKEFFTDNSKFTSEMLKKLNNFLNSNQWNSREINDLKPALSETISLLNKYQEGEDVLDDLNSQRRIVAEKLSLLFTHLMRAVATGGDEGLEIQQENEYTVLRNFLIGMLTNKKVIPGTGMVKLGLEGVEANNLDSAKTRSKGASLVTKIIKVFEEDYAEKYGYTYGERLGKDNEKLYEEVSDKVINYFTSEVDYLVKQIESATSITDLNKNDQKRLQKLLPQLNNLDVWGYALGIKINSLIDLRNKLSQAIERKGWSSNLGLDTDQLEEAVISEDEDLFPELIDARGIEISGAEEICK
ncbi:hypothetical protein HZA97_09850 [Candidatus Woesearchaeota archaeon]|nr:hypothetical protein [Candidatus Woesearchaeota archaeon]